MPRSIRAVTLATLLLALLATPAFASGLYSYLHGGLTSSTLTGDLNGDPKSRLGLHVGLGVQFLATDHFGADTEVNYVQRGLTRKGDANTRNVGADAMTYALNYWQWNGMLHAGLPAIGAVRPALLVGCGVDFKTAETLKIEGGPQAGTTKPDTMDSIDLTSLFGVSFELGEEGRWFADARYEGSLFSIADPLEYIGTDTPNIRNRMIQVGIGYKWQVRDDD